MLAGSTGPEWPVGGKVSAAAAAVAAAAAANTAVAEPAARWADAESDSEAGGNRGDGLSCDSFTQQVSVRALVMSEGMTLEHIDAIRAAVCRKMATFLVAEDASTGDSAPEAPHDQAHSAGPQGREVATAASRKSRPALGGRRR